MNVDFWKGKSVLVTGHTGFKGSWLSLWLKSMGAEVHGYSLEPPIEKNLFSEANVVTCIESNTYADIRDLDAFVKAMKLAKPEIVFHMAAQPLVRYSYENPVETYSVNVMGTVHMLEAVRATPGIKAVVNITTDKCYENREWLWGYRENDAMGGYDPYSSSKGCAELVTSAFRQSFFDTAGIGLASVRAGNVIGGGDWAVDRLIPDVLRAMDAGKILSIRSPNAVRPWQHVLEPLHGYLTLAEQLFADGIDYSGGWNFGPADKDARSVSWIIDYMNTISDGVKWGCDEQPQLHEAGYLKLDSSKAARRLNWYPTWSLEKALKKVLEWHHSWCVGNDMMAVSLDQISEFQNNNKEDSK